MDINPNATPEEKIEAIEFWYEGWLYDNDPSADSIFCQQVGQVLGLQEEV